MCGCVAVSVMHVCVFICLCMCGISYLCCLHICMCARALSVMCIYVYVLCVYECGTFQSPLESPKEFPSKVPLQPLSASLDLCVNYRPHNVTVSTFVSLPAVHSRALPSTSKPALLGALQSSFWLLHKLKHPACSCLHFVSFKVG